VAVHGIHALNTGSLPTIPVCHYRLWDCGATWRDLHLAPNVVDWAPLDLAVAQAQSRGATNLTYCLSATPQWLASDPNLAGFAPWLGPGSNSAPWSMVHWSWFVTQLSTRYLGVIGSIQIWNEPQLKDFWGYDDWTVLAEMTRLANNAIHAVSPSLKVIAGPVLPRPSSGGMTRGGKYLTALKGKGWPCDIWSAHMYPEVGYTPGRWRTFAQNWQSKLDSLGAPTKAKWVTETNYNLFGGPLSDAAIADYMVRTDGICVDEGIFKCYWYAWQHPDPALLGIPFTPTSRGTATLAALPL
jgi:hypothetical protein